MLRGEPVGAHGTCWVWECSRVAAGVVMPSPPSAHDANQRAVTSSSWIEIDEPLATNQKFGLIYLNLDEFKVGDDGYPRPLWDHKTGIARMLQRSWDR